MITRPSPRLRAYVTAGLVGLVGALAVGDPASALVGSVMVALAAIGLSGRRPRPARVAITAPPSATEGAEFDVVVRVDGEGPMRRPTVEVPLMLAEGVGARGARLLGDSTLGFDTVIGSGQARLVVATRRWGRAELGPATLRMESPLGMYEAIYVSEAGHLVTVLPSPTSMRRLLSPVETNLHVGELVSNRRGPGTEFADLRPYHHGDDPRWVNWRVSLRADALWVNDRHPERNGDVVLLVDTHADTGLGEDVVVDRTVRLAAGLIRAHGRRRHRVGVITTDGFGRWVHPGMGAGHQTRLLEHLITVGPGTLSWDAVERTVARTVKRPAMVIVLTSLLDPDLAGIAHSMRRSGIDVSVIELDVAGLLPDPKDEAGELGRRIWAMDADRLRDRLAAEGIASIRWSLEDPPDVPMAALAQLRTSWRRRLV